MGLKFRQKRGTPAGLVNFPDHMRQSDHQDQAPHPAKLKGEIHVETDGAENGWRIANGDQDGSFSDLAIQATQSLPHGVSYVSVHNCDHPDVAVWNCLTVVVFLKFAS